MSTRENMRLIARVPLLYLPDAYIMFKAARTPTLLKAGNTLSARAVPSSPLFLHVDSNV